MAVRFIPGTRALRTLESAGRHLNFTRAADELGLTAAAVSHQIKEIEDQLGIELFVRTSRSIRPTPAGLAMLDACEEALAVLGRAVSKARKLTGATSRVRRASTAFTPRSSRRSIWPIIMARLILPAPWRISLPTVPPS